MDTKSSYTNQVISSSSNVFYVYVHKKSSDGSIFYVGKGKNKRAYSKTGRNSYWRNIVAKHGYTVEIVQNYLPEWLAFELESFLITEYKQCGYTLSNLTDGGEGVSGYTHSEEAKRKLSVILKGHKFNVGRIPSLEARKKMSIAGKGRKRSEETKTKMSDSKKGIKHPLSKLANIYKKDTDELIAENIVIRE